MGCPTSGRVVFVYPVQNPLPLDLVNGLDIPNSTTIKYMSVYNCKELHLELAPSKNRSTTRSNVLPSMNFHAEKPCDPSEIGILSSPKTPLYKSKLSSSSTCHSDSLICEESVSTSLNPKSSSIYSFDIKETIADERTKKLLQICASTWLFSRSLLCGNLVAIPILSELFIFRVVGAKELSVKSSSHDLTIEKGHDLFPEAPELGDHLNHAFVISRDTGVCLYLPSNVASATSQNRDSSGVGIKHTDVKANAVDNRLKLGGLSNEYAILKDIIISSSVKDTLSRYDI